MTDEELKSLNEKKLALAKEIQTRADAYEAAGNQFDAEQRSAYDQVNADFNEVERQIAAEVERRSIASRRQEMVEQIDRESRSAGLPIPGREQTPADLRNGRRAIDEETRARAFRGWLAAEMNYDVNDRDDEAMAECRMSGRRQLRCATPQDLLRRYQMEFRSGRLEAEYADPRIEQFESRAMSTVNAATGGALVPMGFVRALEYNLLAFGGMRQAATLSITQTGESLSLPTFDDTANEGRQVGESENVMADVDPATGAVKWAAYKFTSDALKVPQELLEDTVGLLDLPSTIGLALGERLGRITNRRFTFGTGNGQPRGLLTAAETGVTTTTQAITYDDVISLEHSVNSAYRIGAGYMCSDAILLQLRLLKDGNDQFLWNTGIDVGSPATLNRRPLTINHHMTEEVATGGIPLVFGQLSRYVIRRVGGIRLYRLTERFRDTDEDGFVALIREDGNLINAGTCPVKKLVIG